MEKYYSGVEDEDTKFSGKCLFFQREVRISAMKYFNTALFLYGVIYEKMWFSGRRQQLHFFPWHYNSTAQ